MMQQFEQMSSRLNYKPQELGDIKERLKDDDVRGGAFYCSLPSFRDSYRLVSRIIERNGQSVYLMLCSITNGKGMPEHHGCGSSEVPAAFRGLPL